MSAEHDALFADLEGFLAYDQGATDSGIHDDELRARREAELLALNPWENPAAREALTRWARERYMSDDAIIAGYGWEDALAFMKWIEDDAFRG